MLEWILSLGLFSMFSCVVDIVWTQFLVSRELEEDVAAQGRYRLHDRVRLWARLLGPDTAAFMNGKSLYFPALEVLGASFMVACAYTYGLFSRQMVMFTLGACLLALAAIVDRVLYFFPDEVSYTLIAVGLASALAFYLRGDHAQAKQAVMGGVLALVIVYGGFCWLYRLIRGRPGMGLGDVKICIGVGLLLGPIMFTAFFMLFSILGTFFSLVVLVARGRLGPSGQVLAEMVEEGYFPPSGPSGLAQAPLPTGPSYLCAFLVAALWPDLQEYLVAWNGTGVDVPCWNAAPHLLDLHCGWGVILGR